MNVYPLKESIMESYVYDVDGQTVLADFDVLKKIDVWEGKNNDSCNAFETTKHIVIVELVEEIEYEYIYEISLTESQKGCLEEFPNTILKTEISSGAYCSIELEKILNNGQSFVDGGEVSLNIYPTQRDKPVTFINNFTIYSNNLMIGYYVYYGTHSTTVTS
jgi:hypothetical protein